MELEAVRRVSMGDLTLQIGRQIDNIDCAERAFLWTDTTSYAQALGDEGNFRRGFDFDTKTATTDNGTRLLAFLSAFLERILVRARDGTVSHVVPLVYTRNRNCQSLIFVFGGVLGGVKFE